MQLPRACALVSMLTPACTLPPPRNVLVDATASQEPAPEAAEGWSRTRLEASVIPIAELTRDFDGVAEGSRSEDATGWGVRAGIGDAERSAGLLFQSFRSDGELLD